MSVFGSLSTRQQDGNDLFLHTVMSDVTWVPYSSLERKQQSMQWHRSTSLKPAEFRQSPYSSLKMIAIFFWDENDLFWGVEYHSWNVESQLRLMCAARRSPNWEARSKIDSVWDCCPGQSMLMRVVAPLPKQRRGLKILVGKLSIAHPTVPTLHLVTSSSCIWNSGLVDNSLKRAKSSRLPLSTSLIFKQQTSMERD